MFRSALCRACAGSILAILLLPCGATGAEETDVAEAPTEIEEIDANEAEAEAAASDDADESIADEMIFESQDCISASRISRTDVLDDRTIVFFMHGSDIYLNQLRHRCNGLRRADAFSYDVRTSQLCNVDTIRLIDTFGGEIRQGIGCGLGKFRPITEEQLMALRERGPVED